MSDDPIVLSVSQVESFDHEQQGGCHRRWWFDGPKGLKEPQSNAKNEGTIGHALLATYFRTGEHPGKRVKMGKAVTGAIVKGEMPKPGPDLQVEQRFSGQPMRDDMCNCNHTVRLHDPAGACLHCPCLNYAPRWVPLDHSKTFHYAGYPWDGAIDLAFRRDDYPTVIDHKFSSDIAQYAKKRSELVKTVQMPIYALSKLREWPDAPGFYLGHNYISKTGVKQDLRLARVSKDELLERGAAIDPLVRQMVEFRSVQDQNDVPSNHAGPKRACEAYGGCPHQSICSAFKEKKVALSAEELAVFGAMDPEPVKAVEKPAAVMSAAELLGFAEPAVGVTVPIDVVAAAATVERLFKPKTGDIVAISNPIASQITIKIELDDETRAVLKLLLASSVTAE